MPRKAAVTGYDVIPVRENDDPEVIEASSTQRFKIAQMFQQLIKQDPMAKKIGGQASGLLLEAVRFQFEHLPFKAKKVIRKLQVAGVPDDEWEDVEYYVFRFRWHHPCIDYSTEIVKEIPVEDFKDFK